MVRLSSPAPGFTLPGFWRGAISDFSLSAYRGRWIILFFYPADFSFICPTEVIGFQKLYPALVKEGVEVLGVSVDPPDLHRGWVRELGGVGYPLLSDAERRVTRDYDVLDPATDRAFRATFIIDPKQAVQYLTVGSVNVGRGIEEIHRVVRALQSGRQCPADWHPEPPLG